MLSNSARPEGAVLDVVFAHRQRLQRMLRSAFSSAPPAQIEDAFQEAGMMVCQHPERYAQILSGQGEDALLAAFYTLAWRALRGERRRKASRLVWAHSTRPVQVDNAPNPEALAIGAQLRIRLQPIVCCAARRYGGNQSDRVLLALKQRLDTLDSDAAVSRNHGVPRAYVSYARRWIQTQLPDEFSMAPAA